MRTMLIGVILFSIVIAFSCKQTSKKSSKEIAKNVIASTAINEIDYNDSITKFLAEASNVDTLEFNNRFESNQSFLFFKSGYIISKAEKNALVVVCPTDTTYKVTLYSIHKNGYHLIDSITGLDASLFARFGLIFDDYNFDGQTDIYLQASSSAGWSLSRGHLIIIDPKTKKLELHREARNFANMIPDPKTKNVMSERWNGYDEKDRHQLTIFTNKWIKGKLKTISKKDTLIRSK